MECSWITAMRTGASVGISARYLARQDSRVSGILGCAVQGGTGLMALVEILPELKEMNCYDLFPQAVKRYIEEMSTVFQKLNFKACSTPGGMMEGFDIALSAIPIVNNPKPPLYAGMLEQGILAVSLDYDSMIRYGLDLLWLNVINSSVTI